MKITYKKQLVKGGKRGVDILHLVCFLTCNTIHVDKASTEVVIVDEKICCMCRFYAVYAFIGCNLVHMPR